MNRRVNACISGYLVNSPLSMSSLFSARPFKKEGASLSVVTTEVSSCSSTAAVVVRQKDQGDLYRSGQSLATERSDPSTSQSENNKLFHRVISQPLTRCTEERSDDIAKCSCLNPDVLLSVAEAQVVIKQWRHSYNNEHPHSGLGLKSLL